MENKIISERLLSELTGTNVTSVYYHKKHGWKYTTYTQRNNGWTSFSDIPLPNIYEIGFKCKEWAKEQGYTITSNFQVALINYNYEIDITKPIEVILYKRGEIEAIIKACEWILDNKGN